MFGGKDRFLVHGKKSNPQPSHYTVGSCIPSATELLFTRFRTSNLVLHSSEKSHDWLTHALLQKNKPFSISDTTDYH